jgi:hypothetical protein
MERKVKVVWHEGGAARAVHGHFVGEEAGFLKLRLADGRILQLNKTTIVKIEDMGGGAE